MSAAADQKKDDDEHEEDGDTKMSTSVVADLLAKAFPPATPPAVVVPSQFEPLPLSFLEPAPPVAASSSSFSVQLPPLPPMPSPSSLMPPPPPPVFANVGNLAPSADAPPPCVRIVSDGVDYKNAIGWWPKYTEVWKLSITLAKTKGILCVPADHKTSTALQFIEVIRQRLKQSAAAPLEEEKKSDDDNDDNNDVEEDLPDAIPDGDATTRVPRNRGETSRALLMGMARPSDGKKQEEVLPGDLTAEEKRMTEDAQRVIAASENAVLMGLPNITEIEESPPPEWTPDRVPVATPEEHVVPQAKQLADFARLRYTRWTETVKFADKPELPRCFVMPNALDEAGKLPRVKLPNASGKLPREKYGAVDEKRLDNLADALHEWDLRNGELNQVIFLSHPMSAFTLALATAVELAQSKQHGVMRTVVDEVKQTRDYKQCVGDPVVVVLQILAEPPPEYKADRSLKYFIKPLLAAFLRLFRYGPEGTSLTETDADWLYKSLGKIHDPFKDIFRKTYKAKSFKFANAPDPAPGLHALPKVASLKFMAPHAKIVRDNLPDFRWADFSLRLTFDEKEGGGGVLDVVFTDCMPTDTAYQEYPPHSGIFMERPGDNKKIDLKPNMAIDACDYWVSTYWPHALPGQACEEKKQDNTEQAREAALLGVVPPTAPQLDAKTAATLAGRQMHLSGKLEPPLQQMLSNIADEDKRYENLFAAVKTGAERQSPLDKNFAPIDPSGLLGHLAKQVGDSPEFKSNEWAQRATLQHMAARLMGHYPKNEKVSAVANDQDELRLFGGCAWRHRQAQDVLDERQMLGALEPQKLSVGMRYCSTADQNKDKALPMHQQEWTLFPIVRLAFACLPPTGLYLATAEQRTLQSSGAVPERVYGCVVANAGVNSSTVVQPMKPEIQPFALTRLLMLSAPLGSPEMYLYVKGILESMSTDRSVAKAVTAVAKEEALEPTAQPLYERNFEMLSTMATLSAPGVFILDSFTHDTRVMSQSILPMKPTDALLTGCANFIFHAAQDGRLIRAIGRDARTSILRMLMDMTAIDRALQLCHLDKMHMRRQFWRQCEAERREFLRRADAVTLNDEANLNLADVVSGEQTARITEQQGEALRNADTFDLTGKFDRAVDFEPWGWYMKRRSPWAINGHPTSRRHAQRLAQWVRAIFVYENSLWTPDENHGKSRGNHENLFVSYSVPVARLYYAAICRAFTLLYEHLALQLDYVSQSLDWSATAEKSRHNEFQRSALAGPAQFWYDLQYILERMPERVANEFADTFVSGGKKGDRARIDLVFSFKYLQDCRKSGITSAFSVQDMKAALLAAVCNLHAGWLSCSATPYTDYVLQQTHKAVEAPSTWRDSRWLDWCDRYAGSSFLFERAMSLSKLRGFLELEDDNHNFYPEFVVRCFQQWLGGDDFFKGDDRLFRLVHASLQRLPADQTQTTEQWQAENGPPIVMAHAILLSLSLLIRYYTPAVDVELVRAKSRRWGAARKLELCNQWDISEEVYAYMGGDSDVVYLELQHINTCVAKAAVVAASVATGLGHNDAFQLAEEKATLQPVRLLFATVLHPVVLLCHLLFPTLTHRREPYGVFSHVAQAATNVAFVPPALSALLAVTRLAALWLDPAAVQLDELATDLPSVAVALNCYVAIFKFLSRVVKITTRPLLQRQYREDLKRALGHTYQIWRALLLAQPKMLKRLRREYKSSRTGAGGMNTNDDLLSVRMQEETTAAYHFITKTEPLEDIYLHVDNTGGANLTQPNTNLTMTVSHSKRRFNFNAPVSQDSPPRWLYVKNTARVKNAPYLRQRIFAL